MRATPPIPKVVLISLSTFFNRKTKEWYPSLPTLAEQCCCSVSAVKSALSFLKEKGFLYWEARTRPHSSSLINHYVIPLMEQDAPCDQPSEDQSDNQSLGNGLLNNRSGDNKLNNRSPESREPCGTMEANSEEYPNHDPPGELALTDPTACKPLDEASQAVNAWNEMAAECDLAQVQKLTPDRRKKLNKRLKDCDGIEGWMYALGKIRSTPGLQGKAGKPWKANLDFLIQESKFVKLMEGGYDGWTANGYNTANDFNAAPRQESNRDVFMSALHEVACGR